MSLLLYAVLHRIKTMKHLINASLLNAKNTEFYVLSFLLLLFGSLLPIFGQNKSNEFSYGK